MSDTTKLRAIVTRSGNTIRIRASKGGKPLTQEDHIQLQILEHQVMNYPERVTLNAPITLGD
jgi:hypothetical protein